jgi:hypothetical protein
VSSVGSSKEAERYADGLAQYGKGYSGMYYDPEDDRNPNPNPNPKPNHRPNHHRGGGGYRRGGRGYHRGGDSDSGEESDDSGSGDHRRMESVRRARGRWEKEEGEMEPEAPDTPRRVGKYSSEEMKRALVTPEGVSGGFMAQAVNGSVYRSAIVRPLTTNGRPSSKGAGKLEFHLVLESRDLPVGTSPKRLFHLFPQSSAEIGAFGKEQAWVVLESSRQRSMPNHGRVVEALEDLCREMQVTAEIYKARPGDSGHVIKWAGLLLFYFVRWQHALANGTPEAALDRGGKGWEIFKCALAGRDSMDIEQCLTLLGYQCEICGLAGMTPKFCAVCSRLGGMSTATASPVRLTAPQGYDDAQKALRAQAGNQSLSGPQFLVIFKRAHPGAFSVHADAVKERQVQMASLNTTAGAKGVATKDEVWEYLTRHQEVITPRVVKGRFADVSARDANV